METVTRCSFSPATTSPSNASLKHHRPSSSLHRSNSYKPFSSLTNSPTLPLSLSITRPRIAYAQQVSPKRSYRLLVVSGSVTGDSERYPDAEQSDSNKGGTIDLRLPRRSLLAQFTCGECGERTQRLINRLAYERGLVYVQCAGCERYHKLADNLGLVVEYDLRDENGAESNTDQVC
ncbi:hypothetical protein Tsubulata_014383 [Turnera subulata]|uniref:DNL-type domain-containing protein n=1 Tax=Turnera subulata TaxID=218843 RepID=A0A9Q0GDT3_9ROSI|nr:hypothetical protein Tsubulata_014383 [Turnera subulata]